MKDPGFNCVSELEFDTEKVRADWQAAVFSGISSEHHSRHQAGILLTMANLHRLLGFSFINSIHDLGIGNWAVIRSQVTANAVLKRLVTSVERFGVASNQNMASFAERNQTRLIADLKRAAGQPEFERHRDKARLLNDANSIFGKSIFECKADAKVAAWLQCMVEESAERVFRGQSFVHVEIARIAKAMSRIKALRHAA
jgi:hypothetical protein